MKSILRKENLIIVVLVLLAFMLRIIPVFSNSVSFHYDMSRDAFSSEEIWKYNDTKIQGPPTSKIGLNHGVLYYYLITIPYYIGQGDPSFTAIFLGLLNSLTIIPIFLLSKNIFKSTNSGVFSSLLYVVSFEANQYALWMSNPQPAVFTLAMFFFSLWKWYEGSKWGLPLCLIFIALSAQFQLFLLYLLFPLFLFKFLFKCKISSIHLVYGVICFSVILSPYLISAIKFNTAISAFQAFVSISDVDRSTGYKSWYDLFTIYINKFVDLFKYNFAPTSALIASFLALIALFFAFFRRFILFCLLINIPLFIIGGHSNNYINIGMVTPAILVVTLLIKKVYELNKVLIFPLVIYIFYSNIYSILGNIEYGQKLFVIPVDMTLKNQYALIDQTYKVANGRSFSINSVTLPLWTNTTWSYLYKYYGEKKYGYLPSFYGHNPIGSIGSHILEYDPKPKSISFLIIEPGIGIFGSYYESEILDENSRTHFKKEYKYGSLRLHEREKR